MPRTLHTADDIWTRVDVRADAECWPYLGALTTKGYGQFYFDGRRHQAHRVAYERANGAIPDGLQLDHLCRNRRCCNPSHLEPVTPLENVRRSPVHNGARTHCPQGHPYTGDNVRQYRGGRYCRTCIKNQSAKDNGPGCPGTVDH
jgi:HNH endonuclease